jgi:hypothetical protein|tara:strand:- start:822 stop:1019 length:198 start_codon:yes stop_codon:yes gene_type:complete
MKKYIGKTIELFPGDSQEKIGIVKDVFDDGIEVVITQLGDVPFKSNLKIGDVVYYPTSKLIFKLK